MIRPPSFWSKVQKTDTCWLWTGTTNGKGYGQYNVRRQHVYAHRWSFEASHGPILDGLVVDHLCRNRSCVNPDHLEAVTVRENSMRGSGLTFAAHREDRCIKGHPFTPENTKWQGADGKRHRTCRECRRRRDRDRYSRRAGAR